MSAAVTNSIKQYCVCTPPLPRSAAARADCADRRRLRQPRRIPAVPNLPEAGQPKVVLLLAGLLQALVGMPPSVPSLLVAWLTSAVQSEHKALHKPASRKHPTPLQRLQDLRQPLPFPTDPETGVHDPFPSFTYTGALRAHYPLSPKRKLPDSIPVPDYSADGFPRSEYALGSSIRKIAILDAKGIEGMRKVCRLAREVLDLAAAAARPGVTTDEIDEIVHKACIERDVRHLFT